MRREYNPRPSQAGLALLWLRPLDKAAALSLMILRISSILQDAKHNPEDEDTLHTDTGQLRSSASPGHQNIAAHSLIKIPDSRPNPKEKPQIIRGYHPMVQLYAAPQLHRSRALTHWLV